MRLPEMPADNPFVRQRRSRDQMRRAIAELSSSRNVLSGGTIEGGGDLTLKDGGGIIVDDGGDLTLRDGGDLIINDGGRFIVRYRDSNASGVYFGSSYSRTDQTYNGVSLLVFDVDGNQVFGASGSTVDGNSNVSMWQNGDHQAFWNDFATGDVRITPQRDLTLSVGAERDYLVYGLQETTAAANLAITVVNGTPRLRVSSSAAALKDDLRETTHAKTILDLKTYTWRDRETTDGAIRRAGTTYEDVARVLGDEYVSHGQTITRDDGERQTIAPSVQYDRLFAPLLDLAKTQQTELDALRDRVTALETQGGS